MASFWQATSGHIRPHSEIQDLIWHKEMSFKKNSLPGWHVWPFASDGWSGCLSIPHHPPKWSSHWGLAKFSLFRCCQSRRKRFCGTLDGEIWRAHNVVRGCGVLSRLRRPRLWTTHSEKILVYSAKFVWMKCILDHIRLCKLLCKMCKWLCKWLWASLRMNFFLFTHVHGSIWFWLFNFHPANFDKFCLTARVGAQCYTPRSRNDHWSGLVDPIEHVFPIFSDRQSWMP